MELHQGFVRVTQVANGVLDPTAVGYIPPVVQKARRNQDDSLLARRTRDDFCPKEDKDLVQYAQDVDAVITDLRWIDPRYQKC